MWKLVILALSAACALGNSVPEARVPQLDGRIVGGSPTTIENYPYQVSLQKDGSHWCGGSILKPNYILTAAHCVRGRVPSSLQIRAGSSYSATGGVTAQVAEVIIHSGFNNYDFNNDVAVLRLASDLSLDGITMKAIPLAKSDPADRTSSVVTGWGTLKFGGTLTPQLQTVAVDIISRYRCYDYYKYNSDQITPSMICAGARGKDACQGDSGGPLVANGIQIGIVSWGYGCADNYYPGVYSNVAYLYPWISATVGGL